MSSSFVRMERIASSSSRATTSGYHAAPFASMAAMSLSTAACRRLHREGGDTASAVDLHGDVRVAQRVGFDAALQGRQLHALAPRPGDRWRRPVRAARSCTRAANWLGLTASSTSRHSTAFCPRTPSAVVQKMSARSWRTWRLSVTRVRPPVPGSTPSSGTSGQAHGAIAVVHQDDLVAGQGQLVAAAGAGAVHRGEELQAAVLGRVLQAVAGLVGELAEVHLPGMAGDAQHEDVGAGAEHLLLGAGDDDGAHFRVLEADALARRRSARCRRRGRSC